MCRECEEKLYQKYHMKALTHMVRTTLNPLVILS